MRVLLITKIFPNAVHPDEAPYNRRQFAALSRYCDVRVLATIPWFPGMKRLSKWPVGDSAPREEVIDGLPVRHPRYLYVPRVAPALNGPLYAASMLPELVRRGPSPDVIVGAFAYPDGFAAVCLGRLLGVPVVIKVHGSDIDVIPRDGRLRRPLSWGLTRATRVVAVSRKLADGVAALGVPRDRIDLIMNGVDAKLFQPRNRAEARAALGRSPGSKLFVFVGHLNRDKGVLDLVGAFERLAPAHPDLELTLVGSGAEEEACRAAAARLGGRLTVTGYLPHDQVSLWLGASDALVLPSLHEGTPNVVLEALASGRRVVATSVGGIPDVLHTPELGELIPPGDRGALADALLRAARHDYDPARIAELAGGRDWDDSARAFHDTLLRAVRSARRPSAGGQELGDLAFSVPAPKSGLENGGPRTGAPLS
ncbi:glycosyltransferase family 4 protein [Sorangium sp. So ce1078]|uniref:glycosyltransferase family 4 protein n=1 Tax=Sorangium sp. So ce1078 TaxID=3133329 RepID=UPI003F644982